MNGFIVDNVGAVLGAPASLRIERSRETHIVGRTTSKTAEIDVRAWHDGAMLEFLQLAYKGGPVLKQAMHPRTVTEIPKRTRTVFASIRKSFWRWMFSSLLVKRWR